MNVALVHLSDLHLGRGVTLPEERASRLADAVHGCAPTDCSAIFVVLSGDIAHSGAVDEYVQAGKCLSVISNRLKDHFREVPVHWIAVPGNHDADFAADDALRDHLVQSLSGKADADAALVTACTKPFDHFFGFQRDIESLGAENSGGARLAWTRAFRVGERTVAVSCVNSAWVSRKKEVQGSLYLPPQTVRDCLRAGEASDLSVCVMHHPLNWFEASNGRQIRTALESFCDLVITGHEHDFSSSRRMGSTGAHNDYLEGDVLISAERSAFNVLLIDLEKGQSELLNYVWHDREGLYLSGRPVAVRHHIRNIARLKAQFTVEEAFERQLDDLSLPIQHPSQSDLKLTDVFQYPDLRRSHAQFLDDDSDNRGPNTPDSVAKGPPRMPTREFVMETVKHGDFVDFVVSRQRVVITGAEKSGKSTLCKRLFVDLFRRGAVPVLLRGQDITNVGEKILRRRVDAAVTHQFGVGKDEEYAQLDVSKRAIIIDDIHLCPLNTGAKEQVSATLRGMFGIIVVAAGPELDLQELVADGVWKTLITEFENCEILPFGHELRHELVSKWCWLGSRESATAEEKAHEIEQTKRTVNSALGRNLVPPYPFFLLVLLQRISQDRSGVLSSGSFAHLYEALVRFGLAGQSRLVDLDTAYTYLSEFAFKVLQSQRRLIDPATVQKWHDEHCAKFRLQLDFARVESAMLKSGLWCRRGSAYGFQHTYSFCYFAARYVNDHLDAPEMQAIVRNTCENLFSEDAANVLLFLCHLSKSRHVLDPIFEAADKLFMAVPEERLASDPTFLGSNVQLTLPEMPQDPVAARQVAVEQRRDALQFEITWDADTETPAGFRICGSEEEANKARQIKVAYKAIEILGQILRNFHGSLDGEQKCEIAERCYALAGRTLNIMYSFMAAGKHRLLEDLKRHHDSKFIASGVGDTLEDANEQYADLAERMTFGLVKHVSDCVGHEKLLASLDDAKRRRLARHKQDCLTQLLNISVLLDCSSKLPIAETLDANGALGGRLFVRHLLMHLVWYRLYLYESSFREKQQLCDGIGMRVRTSFLNADVKRPRREAKPELDAGRALQV